jgi:hypothetical protein
MPDSDEFPAARRALGAALVTGASGAGLGLSLARPLVHDGIDAAFVAAKQIRESSLRTARAGLSAAVEGGRPALGAALEAKDRMRRRAVGALPPAVGDALEAWRREFIEGEKALYFGSRRFSEEFEPAFEVARARSRNLLQEAVRAFEDVADVTLATSIKLGEAIQEGELPKPPRRAGAAQKPKAARKKPARRRA